MNTRGKSLRTSWMALSGFLIFMLACAFCTPASAAEKLADQKRPKIGLVLGGGGAKGTAHIGVIKVLEELRIPIDYIAGTSMGAVVGSFYAAGMSASELETVLTSLDWDDLFQDNPGRDEIPFRRKQEDFTYMTKLTLGVKDGGIRLPPSLMAAQKISVLFQSLLLPVAGITDFNKLPIPYRAIAADLETGDMVVLQGGSLADAARASMSVPGVFPPAEVAGRFLIDGGIVRNLPMDIVRAMGADVLIVVDVGKPLPKRDEITSSLKVLGQMLDIMMKANVDAQIATLTDKDVFIRPELGTLESGDFQRGKEGAGYGEKAARTKIDQLRRFSVSEQEYAAFQAKHRFHDIARVRIGTVTVEADRLKNIPKDAVESRVKLKEGEELTVEQLQKRVSLLYGMGEFERVDLHVNQKGDALDVTLTPVEKSWGPNYLRFGLNLETNFSKGSKYNFLIDYTKRWVNELGAEWKTLIQVGSYTGLLTEFYQPLEKTHTYFVAPYARIDQNFIDVYDGKHIEAEYRLRRALGGVDFGIEPWSYGEFRLGYVGGLVKPKVQKGHIDISEDTIEVSGIRARLIIDQIDNVNFPRKGFIARVNAYSSLTGLGADDEYNKLDVQLGVAHTFGKKYTVLGSVRYATFIGPHLPAYDNFSLGGFLNLSGLASDQLQGDRVGFGRLVFYYQASKSMIGDLYLGGSVEAGNAWRKGEKASFDDLRYSGSAFVGFDSLFGPLYFAYGHADGGYNAVYLYLGRTF